MSESKDFLKQLNNPPKASESESKLWDYFTNTPAYLWIEDFTAVVQAFQAAMADLLSDAEPYAGYLNHALAGIVSQAKAKPMAIFGNRLSQRLSLSPARNKFESNSLIARAYQGLLRAVIDEVNNGVTSFEKSAYWMIEGKEVYLQLQFEVKQSDNQTMIYVVGMETEPVKPHDTKGLVAQYALLFEMTQSILMTSNSKKFLEKSAAAIHKYYDSAQTIITLVDLEKRCRTQVFLDDREFSEEEKLNEITEHDFWDGLSGWVIRTGETVYSPKNVPDYRETDESMANRIKNDACAIEVVPNVSGQQLLGTLTIIHKGERGAINPYDIQVAETVSNQLAIGLQHFRLLERTRLMAHSDLVTGLSNREHFMQLAEAEFEESTLKRSSLGVIMLDIDFFKEINEQHGFQVGDDVLREVGQRVRAHLINKHSVSTRYDGDEFVILMSVDSDRALWNAAEELRIAISNTPVASSPVVLKISTSVGIAFVEGKSHEMNLREMLNRASQALAQAKQNGRNCVWPAR